jgi:predicted dehydrogenase
MKQVFQNASGTTFVRDVPPPANPPHNVLVRNAYSIISSGTERSRVQLAQKSLLVRLAERPELALKVVEKARSDGLRRTRELIRENLSDEGVSGYSSAGIVLEVGSAALGLSVGDRVACGGAGHANHAEVVSVPANLCVKVPDGVSTRAAALTTIASIALHGCRLTEMQLGDRVAIIGCGLVGRIACRLASAAGASVIALDIDPARVEAAEAHGAAAGVVVGEATLDAVAMITDGLGVDAVVVTAAASTSDPLVLATQIARDRAAVVLVGDVPVDVPRAAFYDKELSFRVSRSYGPGRYDPEYEQRGLDYPISYVRWTERRNMECVLDLQARARLLVEDLISDVLPVEKAIDAYQRLSGPTDGRPEGAIAFSYAEAEPAAPAAKPAPVVPLGSQRAVRIGLVGPGGFALAVLVPALKRAGAELVAVAGGSGPRAEALTREGGFARTEESPEALMAADDLDAVVIATRHGSHAELATEALLAGKHVFCEKPVALDRDGLAKVVAAAERAERVFTVGFNRRFAPYVRSARAFIEPMTGPCTAVYRISAGQIPSGSWIHDLEEGGGRIIGECGHFFDTLSYLIGARISRVQAAGYVHSAQAAQATDNVVISLQYADGSVATVAFGAAGASGVEKERLEIFRGKRTAVIEDYRSLLLFEGQKQRKTQARNQDKGHVSEVIEFLNAVRTGVQPIPLTEIRNVHDACFASIEALTTGSSISLGV